MEHPFSTALKITPALVISLACGSGTAADLTTAQKDGVCRTGLARINANAAFDYKNDGVSGDTRRYSSRKGYPYECEVFSDGKAFTLSSPAWGRLKPTGNVTTEGKCSAIRLFDPGVGVTHDLRYCAK